MLAVCAYMLAMPFMPFQVMAVALVALTVAFVWAPPTPGMPDPGFAFLLPVLPFLAAMLLAIAHAPNPPIASAVMAFLLPGLLCLTMMARRPDIEVRHWLVAFSLFSVALNAEVIFGWARVKLGAPLPVLMEISEGALMYSRNQLLIVPNDSCAMAILLVFPMALLAQQRAGRPARALAIATILLTALSLAILRTRTGLMVALLEVLVVSLAWRRALIWLVPILACLVAGDQLIGAHMLEKLTHANNMDNHGVAGRLGLWASAWAMFETAPILGHGGQAFGPQHGALLPAWSPRFPERHVMWAHSLYLETLADQGLLGITALLILLLHPVCQLCHKLVKVRRNLTGSLNVVVALAGFAGFLVAAGLELSFIRRWVAVVLFGLIGFAHRALREGQTRETEPAGI